MPRSGKATVCVSLRVTFDPDVDAPFLRQLAATPRGKRAALVRQLIRSAYSALGQPDVASHAMAERADSWLDHIAGGDDEELA